MSEIPDFWEAVNQAYRLQRLWLWTTAFGFQLKLDSKPLLLTLPLVLFIALPF